MGFHEKVLVYPVVWAITGPSGATAFVLDGNGQKVPGITGQAVDSTDPWEAYIKYIHISS
jgi:hypothetical protein